MNAENELKEAKLMKERETDEHAKAAAQELVQKAEEALQKSKEDAVAAKRQSFQESSFYNNTQFRGLDQQPSDIADSAKKDGMSTPPWMGGAE